jgi:hypothetical protein
MKNRFGKRRQFLPKLENRFPWFLVSGIVLIGAVMRALLLFGTSLVPGINGAYYLVQARSLIEHGKLGIPDLPLTFGLQAMLAKIVQWVSGASLETSIVFAVKCADAMLPPLIAIPVFGLVRHWTRRMGAGNWVPACAALAAAAGAPALMMVGDFQKNSLALLWLAALLWAWHQWFEQPSFKRAVLPVLFLGLIGLTHIGVFGWALALTVPVVAIALWRSKPENRRLILPWLFVGGSACALAAGLVLWKFDPARISRLANAATHPFGYLQQNQMPGNPANGAARFTPNMANNPRPQFSRDRGNFQPGAGANRFGARQPGMAMAWNWVPTAALLAASIGALAAVWFKRKSLPVSSFAVIGACGLVLFVLCGPWVTGDKVMRFRLIAVGPALLCASFALLQINPPKIRNAFAAVMMLALVVPGITHVVQGSKPVITAQAADELRAMSAEIKNPSETLIVARHGLEWWTAWYLHTHIAHENAVTSADWKNFDSVYFLHQKAGMQMPGGPAPLPGQGNRHFPPDRRPDFAGLGFPSQGDFNNRAFPPRGFGGPGAMGEPRIPEDADVTHDGEFFTLALAPAPEAFAAKTNAIYAQNFN